MNANGHAKAFASSLRCEHDELQQLVRSVAQAMHPAADDPLDADLARIALIRLYDCLAKHFRREEQGGYLDEAATRLPECSTQVNQLLAEHHGLLERCKGLIRGLERDSQLVHRPAWLALAQEFLEAICAHEAHENLVVLKALNTGDEI